MSSKLIDLARKFGEKIRRQRSSDERISKMCDVSLEEASTIRSLIKEPKEQDQQDQQDQQEPASINPYLHDKEYYHNKGTDTYIFTLPGVPKPCVFPGQVIRDLVRAYSSFDSTPSTLNECSRTFGIPRQWTIRILRAMGVTHDSLPFTDEEISERGDESLAEEAQQLRVASLYRRLERDKWKTIQRDAMKWSQYEVNTLRPIIAAIESRGDTKTAPPRVDLKLSESPYIAVLGLSDLHFGKYSDVNENWEGYDRKVCRDRLFSSSEAALSKLTRIGRPEKIILPIASDFLHVDNDANATTRGTPQDSDCTPAEMLIGGLGLMEEYVEFLRTISDVHLVLISGNHDRMMGLAIMLALEALYRDCDDVHVDRAYTPRQYITYGSNLIGFVHGDGVSKIRDLAGHMAREASDSWGTCSHKTVYTGHLHNEKTEVDNAFGVTRRQLPSLSGPDRWHARAGYVGAPKALPVYVHDANDGLVAIFYGGVAKK